MTSVLVIGIDGLDSSLLSIFKDSLPNFKKITENSPSVKFQSVFPPDSSTAWASIYTGLTPAKHGIVFFKDPFNLTIRNEIQTHIFKKTFWRFAEEKRKKVCALYPFLPIDPSYDQIYPAHLIKKYDFVKYEPLPLYSSWKLEKIIDKVKKRTLTQCRVGLDIYKDSDWDLFFIYFPDLDNIEHLFWRFYDKNDPEYQSDNPYREVIVETYKLFDREVIGKFLRVIESDVFIVLSDHGHTRRPINIVNINEILRRAGFLSFKKSSNYASNLRKAAIKLMNDVQILRRILLVLWKFLPRKSKELYMKTTPIAWQNTMAALSEPGQVEGLKTYSYAGIKINRNLYEQMYERICQDLINLIYEIKEPKSSTRIVEWVCKREELYSGEHILNYPDIVFKLRDEWGVGVDAGTNCSIFSSSYSHKIYSGMHKLETPVFIINSLSENMNININKNNISLMDIAPTILDILCVKRKHLNFDGKSILGAEK